MKLIEVLAKRYMGNDISEIGYKYQMTDLSACLGLAALDDLDYLINTGKL